MKTSIWMAAILSVSIGRAAEAAPVIAFGPGSTVVPGQVFEDFDSYADGTAIGTSAFAYTSSKGSTAARPAFGSTNGYGAVQIGGEYAVRFAPTELFAFTLGSLDTFNRLTLSFADMTSITYNGSQITDGGQADGNQVSPLTNGVVSYTINGGPKIVGATFFSPAGDAFEFDNLAVGAPEPATWAMMIMGFGLVGAAMRRRVLQISYA